MEYLQEQRLHILNQKGGKAWIFVQVAKSLRSMTVCHDYSHHHAMVSHTVYCNPKVSDGIGYLKRHWNILTNIAYP